MPVHVATSSWFDSFCECVLLGKTGQFWCFLWMCIVRKDRVAFVFSECVLLGKT